MREEKFSPEKVVKILRACNNRALPVAERCAACPDVFPDCLNHNTPLLVADAIEELLAQVKWNRVGEKLPDLDDGVVLIDGEMVAVQVLAVIAGAEKSTVLYFDGEEFFDYTGDEIIPYRVTHWRPMPEVPREED